MHPPRLGIILLLPLLIALAGVSPSFAQRRVFTNDDFPKPAPPPAPPAAAAAEPEVGVAEGTPGEETAPSAVEEPQPDPNLPPLLSASNLLQSALQRFNTEVVVEFEAEPNLQRQERLQVMMDSIRQMLVQNQLFIAELRAQHEAAMAAEAEAQAQAGAPPAP